MSHDAILVNVSRGQLVDEPALIDALRARTIGGAALDVFVDEPLPPDSPFWTLPNVLITPHTSGFRPDHWDAATALFAENLQLVRRRTAARQRRRQAGGILDSGSGFKAGSAELSGTQGFEDPPEALEPSAEALDRYNPA